MAPAFGVPSYHMASGYPGHPGGPGPSPMMGSLLGLHAGKPGGPAGPGVPPHGPGLMSVGSPPGPNSPHFYLPPFPREPGLEGGGVMGVGAAAQRRLLRATAALCACTRWHTAVVVGPSWH